MKVLVTGGAGYIGSTTCRALSDAGHTPIILDSLINGREEFTKGYEFFKGDIADTNLLEQIFKLHPDIYCCIHFAALIVVPESVSQPYSYYKSNVDKSLDLFKNLDELGCKRIVFSSSAALYGVVPGFMVTEKSLLNPQSPYARTKFMMEMVLEDMSRASGFKGMALRYFNPIGADPQMRVGPYDPNPSHILGILVETALGNREVFNITGVDYFTRDGSGIRDYIHVWDLAKAHVKAVEKFDYALEQTNDDYVVINLGTGDGTTVKEFVKYFENIIGHEINKKETELRPGDVAGAYANVDLAVKLLGWKTELSIEQGIKDTLHWVDVVRPEKLGY